MTTQRRFHICFQADAELWVNAPNDEMAVSRADEFIAWLKSALTEFDRPDIQFRLDTEKLPDYVVEDRIYHVAPPKDELELGDWVVDDAWGVGRIVSIDSIELIVKMYNQTHEFFVTYCAPGYLPLGYTGGTGGTREVDMTMARAVIAENAKHDAESKYQGAPWWHYEGRN